MRKITESLATWQARIDELIRTERAKAAVGRAASSTKGQAFTLPWLEKQCPELDRLKVAALLEGFLIRNGWAQRWGETPNGRTLYVMHDSGRKAFAAYDETLTDIQNRGIDPVEEARLHMLQKGMATEEMDEQDQPTFPSQHLQQGRQGSPQAVVAQASLPGTEPTALGSRARTGEENTGVDDMVKEKEKE